MKKFFFTNSPNPIQQSITNIEKSLLAMGASHISRQYNQQSCTGIICSIYDTAIQQSITYQFKPATAEAFNKLWKKLRFPLQSRRQSIHQKAEKLAWQNLSTWMHQQERFLSRSQAQPLQILLPFMFDMRSGETLHQKINEGKVKLLQ